MNWVDVDAGSRGGYKDGIPAAGLLPVAERHRLHLPEHSLDRAEQAYLPLVEPAALKRELPASDTVRQTVSEGRAAIQNILMKTDPRLLVIAGPCSIHDERAAIDYARRLSVLKERVAETMFVVMRTYFEKPRTATGWKGLLNDPQLNGTCDVAEGLRRARRILIEIGGMGLPAATEMLDPTTPAYISDLISWSAIGARTTESQTHREMASGLGMPVGFKNSTDGNLMAAMNAIRTAGSPQTFPGIDQSGRTVIVKTTGNPWGHLVLRGGERPNYHSENIEDIRHLLREKGLSEVILVDCSHGNSKKDHRRQSKVMNSVIRQRTEGNDALIGLMLESHLYEGRQSFSKDPSALAYGVSVTDACIGWEETERLLLTAHDRLKSGRHHQDPDEGKSDDKKISAADVRPVTFRI